MREITELTDKTSSYELFTHVYWQLVSRKIIDFTDLVKYLDPVEDGPRKEYVLQSAFPLIREIHWGFFRELNPRSYPLLWRQLVLPHNRYDFGGELKLSMTIPDVYCAFVDIHGYTAFANSPKDAPLLRLLDVCIETDVKEMCRTGHVIANRVRGDEIILLGTSAYDVVNSVIMIADYFGDQTLTGRSGVVRRRHREQSMLPRLTISAGIAGGKKYTTLVITAGGDLSGTVVNTAARLQSRANSISGNNTRILATETVKVKYAAEERKEFAPMFTGNQLAFFEAGVFDFKGVELRLVDILMEPEQMYRMAYQKSLHRFLSTLKSGSWADKVFPALIDLLVEAVKSRGRVRDSEKILAGLHTAAERFESGRGYTEAVELLRQCVTGLESLTDFDNFLLLYARAAVGEYRRLSDSFENILEEFLESNRKNLLGQEENRRFEESLGYADSHAAFRKLLEDKVGADKRRLLWKHLVKGMEPSVQAALYLGK